MRSPAGKAQEPLTNHLVRLETISNHELNTSLAPSRQRAPSYGDGEEREEMLLKLSDLSLELNLSLEWSTNLRE